MSFGLIEKCLDKLHDNLDKFIQDKECNHKYNWEDKKHCLFYTVYSSKKSYDAGTGSWDKVQFSIYVSCFSEKLGMKIPKYYMKKYNFREKFEIIHERSKFVDFLTSSLKNT